MSAPLSSDVVCFGATGASGSAVAQYTLHIPRLELRDRDRLVDIRPQAVRALALLLRQQGDLVGPDQLRRELWGDRHLEWRNGLHRCVRDLRCALDDDARHPRFVATVGRLGYRFVGELASPGRIHTLPMVAPTLPVGARQRLTAFATGVGVALLLPLAFLLACIAAA